MKNIAIILAVLFLTSCATTAVLPGKAIDAPSDRVFLYQKPFENSSTLIVVRDSGYLGSGCYSGVFINGQRSASLKPGEKVAFHLEPGEWNVATKGEGSFCMADAIPTGRDFNLKKGESKAVRLFADPSGNVDVKPLPLN